VGVCLSDLLLRRRATGAFDGDARARMAVVADRTKKASESRLDVVAAGRGCAHRLRCEGCVLRALCEAGRIGRVVYILRIRGCGVVECNAPVATRWQWRLGRLHCICALSLARTHTRPARQGLQSLVANPSVNDISPESLMRTEPGLVISGPAACGSPAVANEIGVKVISCSRSRTGLQPPHAV
jgi:hypothetical protein